jgi:hypothetical protein
METHLKRENLPSFIVSDAEHLQLLERHDLDNRFSSPGCYWVRRVVSKIASQS